MLLELAPVVLRNILWGLGGAEGDEDEDDEDNEHPDADEIVAVCLASLASEPSFADTLAGHSLLPELARACVHARATTYRALRLAMPAWALVFCEEAADEATTPFSSQSLSYVPVPLSSPLRMGLL